MIILDENQVIIHSIRLLPNSEKHITVPILPNYRIVILGKGEVYFTPRILIVILFNTLTERRCMMKKFTILLLIFLCLSFNIIGLKPAFAVDATFKEGIYTFSDLMFHQIMLILLKMFQKPIVSVF